MAEKFDPKELVTFKELLISKVIQSDVLINLLDCRGHHQKEGTLGGGDETSAGNIDEKRRDGKRMSQITMEEALDIAESNIGSLFHIKITDMWNVGWPIYAADRLTNCWYITFSLYFGVCAIGAS